MNSTSEWIKLSLRGKQSDVDTLAAVMSMINSGIMIEDYSDLSTEGMYGALIDEAILNADKTRATVSVFLPAEVNLGEARAFLSERIDALHLDAEIFTEGMREEDWAEAWKKYYHPIPLGRVTVVPAWEDYTPKDGEAVIRMDPGMAFGTGTHETTRLVMEMMQEELKGGERVLDVGTGSGILALCASKLGAKECYAYDIDPVAVRVARENVAADGATNVFCGVSDLLKDVDTKGGKFDFVLANIVADIILRLLPELGSYMTDGGRVILSGIIGGRADEIKAALPRCGFAFVREAEERDWYAILARKI
jgi:ribosomal protein L11 methyltransferase